MARLQKTGLDYFPLDVDFFSDEKIEAIAGEFGTKGELTIIKLLCAVYRNGYFAVWSELLKMKLAKQVQASPDLLEQIVDRLVKWDFFNKTLFNSAKVLSSKAIQIRYFEAIKRRKITSDIFPYLLINVNINPQSKVKESKVKEIKEKEIKKTHTPPNPQGEVSGEYKKGKKEKTEKTEKTETSSNAENQNAENQKTVTKNIKTKKEENQKAPYEVWIENNAPRVSQMQEPFTHAQFAQLKKDFSEQFIIGLLKEMTDYIPLFKYISADATFRRWAIKRVDKLVNSNPDINAPERKKAIEKAKRNERDKVDIQGNRINALRFLTEAGFHATENNNQQLEFYYKEKKITYTLLTNVYTGETITSGRGLESLLSQIKG